MAAASSGGEANELVDEVAGSAVNEMGDAMAAATKAPRNRGSRGRKKCGDQRRDRCNEKG